MLTALLLMVGAGAADPIVTYPVVRSGRMEVVSRNLRTGAVRTLFSRAEGVNYPSWSPDGSKIMFSSSGNLRRIFVTGDGGVSFRALTTSQSSADQPDWSPDGARIVFNSNRTGNWDIYAMNADGSGQTNLTSHPSWDADPKWSPDGSRIAFVSKRTGEFRLWVMNADGSDPRQLLDENFERYVYPDWSADGKQIVYTAIRDSSFQLFVVNADGTGIEQLTNREGLNGFATWSPDNRSIAYAHFDRQRSGAAQWYAKTGDLVLIDLIEGDHRVVSKGDVNWRPRLSWKPMPP